MSDALVNNNTGRLRNRMIGSTQYGTETGVRTAHPEVQGIPQVDLSTGMLHGYKPDYGQYVSNTGYAPRNVIPLLMEAPRGFEYLPDTARAVAVLKNIMETQAKTITGLRSGYNVDSTQRQVSGAGHQQWDPSNVTEEISEIQYTWDERYGKAFQHFWMHYIRNLISDPTTKQPGVMNLVSGTDEPTDHLADFYSFTMLFIEPDPLGRYAIDAWLVSNMYPKQSGTHEVGFDRAADFAVPELQVGFTGIPVRSVGVQQLAQEILESINYLNAGPIQQLAHVSSVSTAIQSVVSNGYREYMSSYSASGAAIQNGGEFPVETSYTGAGGDGALVNHATVTDQNLPPDERATFVPTDGGQGPAILG